MTAIHEVIGIAVVALFAIGWVWGLGAWIGKRGPGTWFWRWLAVAQVVAALQALLGVWLLVSGRALPQTLHLIYGFGPLVILAVGHALARDRNFAERPWVPFALASFICFGLALRALMTGLGIG